MVEETHILAQAFGGTENDDTRELMIPIDLETTSLRLTVLLTFIGGSIAGYIVVNTLLRGETCSILALFGGLGIGTGLMTLVEKGIKPRLKPTRFLHADETTLQVLSKGETQRVIDPDLQVNVLMWHFRIKRRTRVPKGWYVVAIALEQDGVYLPVYTLASPEGFETLNSAKQFTQLAGRKELAKLQSERGLRQAGLQRRLHTAEFARSVDGVEMSPDDFATYIDFLQTHYPKWMPAC